MELRKITQLAWKKFLSSEEGKEGLLWLHQRIPTISKGPSDEVLFEAGRAQGRRDGLVDISEMLATPQNKEIDASND